MKPIILKSLDEVLARFRELVHRHRRRFLKRYLRPCPNNCRFATVVGDRVTGCPRCGSRNPEMCKMQERFVPLYSKDELAEQFRQALHDPEVLLRDYRDLCVFMWVTGQFDNQKVDPTFILAPVASPQNDASKGDSQGIPLQKP